MRPEDFFSILVLQVEAQLRLVVQAVGFGGLILIAALKEARIRGKRARVRAGRVEDRFSEERVSRGSIPAGLGGDGL